MKQLANQIALIRSWEFFFFFQNWIFNSRRSFHYSYFLVLAAEIVKEKKSSTNNNLGRKDANNKLCYTGRMRKEVAKKRCHRCHDNWLSVTILLAIVTRDCMFLTWVLNKHLISTFTCLLYVSSAGNYPKLCYSSKSFWANWRDLIDFNWPTPIYFSLILVEIYQTIF